uniref:Uncharacterized protein n=1 Tax=Strix occidentalis caurina TaxID=311401 RepID=A0A8D0KS53_STROC
MDERLLRALGGLSLQPPRRRFGGRLVLLRGLPGSGKSTLASSTAPAPVTAFWVYCRHIQKDPVYTGACMSLFWVSRTKRDVSSKID